MEDQIYKKILFTDKEVGFACTLCQSFERSTLYPVKRHIIQAHFGHAVDFNGSGLWPNCRIPFCKNWCVESKRGHYHCFHCDNIFQSRSRFIDHLSRIPSTNIADPPVLELLKEATDSKEQPIVDTDNEKSKKEVSGDPPVLELSKEATDSKEQPIVDTDSEKSKKKVSGVKVDCTTCGKIMLKKNLQKHINSQHLSNMKCVTREWHHRGSCIDQDHGLYLVSENMSGVQHPIHVQKFIIPGRTPILFCEATKCQERAAAHGISGMGNFECDHLLSTQYLYTTPVNLDTDFLDGLVE